MVFVHGGIEGKTEMQRHVGEVWNKCTGP